MSEYIALSLNLLVIGQLLIAALNVYATRRLRIIKLETLYNGNGKRYSRKNKKEQENKNRNNNQQIIAK